jgi:thioredoxin reductase (NADPH)
MEDWDLIIVGAGPAGLTAGIYAGRAGLKTLLLEEKMAGGQVVNTPLIENYPGFESVAGFELVGLMAEQCRKSGSKINEVEKVNSASVKQEAFLVETDKASYASKSLIFATGAYHRLLDVPGEAKYQGRGVSYCALCDGAFFKGKQVMVVGGGNSAAASARYLANVVDSVKLVHRRDRLRAERAYMEALKDMKVEFLWNSEVLEIRGDGAVQSVSVRNLRTGQVEEIKVDGVFIQVGEVPNSEIAKFAGVKLDEKGYIIVGLNQETNIRGIYAAGDVANRPVKQIGTAVGEAIVAATEAYGNIKRPYYYKPKK